MLSSSRHYLQMRPPRPRLEAAAGRQGMEEGGARARHPIWSPPSTPQLNARFPGVRRTRPFPSLTFDQGRGKLRLAGLKNQQLTGEPTNQRTNHKPKWSRDPAYPARATTNKPARQKKKKRKVRAEHLQSPIVSDARNVGGQGRTHIEHIQRTSEHYFVIYRTAVSGTKTRAKSDHPM